MQHSTLRSGVARQRSRAAVADALERRALLAGISFGTPTPYGSGSSLGVVTVDLNGDGHPDVVAPNSATGGSDGVTVYLNNGTGAFGAGTSFTTSSATGLSGLQPYAVATGDFNGDGHQDVAVANYGSGTLSVLFGDGTGALGAPAVLAAGSTPNGIAVGDLNGDGHPDIVVANRGSDSVSVFLNNGDGTFAPAVNYAVGASPNGVAVADLNGDGHPDIVTPNTGDGTLSVLLNNGNGTFAAAASVPDAGAPIFVAVADMNGDSFPDLVVSNNGGNTVDVLLGNGSGTTFPTTHRTAVGGSPFNLVVGDFNGDGARDVAVDELTPSTVGVLLGNGDGTLQADQSFAAGVQSASLAAADLNGDGSLDLVVGSYNPGGSTPAFTTLLNTGAPATASTGTGYASSGAFNQATASAASKTVEDFSAAAAGTVLTTGSTLDGITYGFQVADTSAQIGITTGGNSISGKSLSLLGSAAFSPGDVISMTFPTAVNFVGVFSNTNVPAAYTLTLGTATATNAATTHDSSTFTFTGVVSATPFATATYTGLASTGTNQYGIPEIIYGTLATPTTTVKTIGGLDPSFGSAGLASHDVGFTATSGVAADGAQSVLVGPIGAAPTESFGVTRYNADGSLDTSFGSGGVTASAFPGTDAVPAAVKVLADGDILVAGTATTYAAGVAIGSQFAIAEYTPAGALDPAFGTGGQALFGFGAALLNDVLRTMAVGPGGVIYLGGSSDAAGKGNADLAVARLTAAGAPDPAFGTAGKTLVDVAGGDDVVNGLAVQPNGAVVAAGSAVVGGVTEVALARFLTTGKLDPRFGTKGITTTRVGGVYDAAESVVVQPKGQIVVGGLTASGAGAALSSDFLVQQYTSAGRLDRTFGAAGTAVTDFGQPAAVTQVVLQSDGSIVASGKTTASLASVVPSALEVAVARYTTAGKLDTAFAGTGKAIVDLSVGVVSNAVATARVVLALDPAIASSLGAAFDAFTTSAQGVVAVTAGGEILSAGNSGSATVEAELVTAGVDLVAKILSALPASVLAGLRGTATVTVTEDGTTQAAGSVAIQLQFAGTATGSGALGLTPVVERVKLRQGQSKSYRLPFTYPTGLTSGAYYLLATVNNGAGVPADLDAGNNTAATATAVRIAPPFTSLGGSDLAAASAFVAGKTVTVSIVVANGGNVPAKGKSTVELFLSTDATIADGTQIANVPLPLGLSAGKSKPYRFRFALPKTTTAGTFTLLAVLDPLDSLGTDDAAGALVVDASPVTVS